MFDDIIEIKPDKAKLSSTQDKLGGFFAKHSQDKLSLEAVINCSFGAKY